jgi:hypothetical protein
MTAVTCRWTGVSGWVYEYEVHPLNTPLAKVPGNYGLCRIASGYWEPLYFGEAEDLSARCGASHEKWAAAVRLGATHIHVKGTAGGKASRCAEETDLRKALKPPLNDQ